MMQLLLAVDMVKMTSPSLIHAPVESIGQPQIEYFTFFHARCIRCLEFKINKIEQNRKKSPITFHSYYSRCKETLLDFVQTLWPFGQKKTQLNRNWRHTCPSTSDSLLSTLLFWEDDDRESVFPSCPSLYMQTNVVKSPHIAAEPWVRGIAWNLCSLIDLNP